MKNKHWIIIALLGLGFIAAKPSTVKSRVGYINSNDLWAIMPEKSVADAELEKMKKQLVEYVQSEQMNFEKGVMSYQKDSINMTPLQKKQTVSKLLSMQESIQALPQQANEELSTKQNQLYEPIRAKMQKAIDEVAAANGYDYVLDQAFGNIIFVRDTTNNLLPLVKQKLGL